MGLVAGIALLVLAFLGLCVLFAWLMNDWMMKDEDATGDAASMGATDDPSASQADNF